MVSDRDPVFTSHFWRRLLELCGIRADRSSTFHPQTDGQTERLNSVLEHYLLPADRLGQPPPPGKIFLQQLEAFCHNSHPDFRKLWVPSADVPPPVLPSLPKSRSRLVCETPPRGSGDSATGTPKGPKSNGTFRRSASSAGPGSCPRSKSVAPTQQYFNHASLFQVGCTSPGTLNHHWPSLILCLPARAATVDAHPSGVPC